MTDDVKKRLSQHAAGRVASTKAHLPHALIGYEGYALKSDATRREQFLKTTEGRRLFRQQYRDVLKKVSGEMAERPIAVAC